MKEANEFVTLALLAVGGRIQGKTKLQKSMYFLGLMTGRLEELGYRPHFYGPYSDDVASAITWLKTIGAIDQNVTDWGRDGGGFEVRRYDFQLNERGKPFAESTARQQPGLWKALQAAAGALEKAGNIDYMAMSIAAKTYFMLDRKKAPASTAELAKLAPQFGWDVKPEQVQEAAAYLQRLGLVEAPRN